MINLDQIEEWIHEVEDRPSSAPLIIRYVANRLKDLSSRNEELLAENIELRTGRKVEEYESRIANLEYQLDLLKRQLEGEVTLQSLSAGPSVSLAAPVNTISFLVYNPNGLVLRVEIPVADLVSGGVVASIASPPEASGALEASGTPESGGPPKAAGPLRLLATIPTEELLFVFDSGRTETRPVSEIPASTPGKIDWRSAVLIEPHGNEDLVTVLPAARMTLYDCCVQVSRRGCAKKMMKTAFESHVSKSFIGAGVKGKPDKTCALVLCKKEDQLVLASREGFLWLLDVDQLPYTIEEVLKLGTIDYLAAAFALPAQAAGNPKPEIRPDILVVTHNGKAIHREAGWLEKPASFKSRGQPVFSQARRESGVRVAGAAAVSEDDWGAALGSDGSVTVYKVSELLEAGSLVGGDPASEIVEFITFSAPGAAQA